MPQYFFHLYNHLEVPDEEGKFLADLVAAQTCAIEIARDVMSENIRAGEICLSHRIEIEDEQGRQLMVVHFRDALTILP